MGLKANSEYHKYQPTSLQIQWFWRALRSFDQADRAKFLQFVTGTSKVPLQGFAALEGMNVSKSSKFIATIDPPIDCHPPILVLISYIYLLTRHTINYELTFLKPSMNVQKALDLPRI